MKIDLTSRLHPEQARNILAEIFNYNPNLICGCSFKKNKPRSCCDGLERLRGAYE